jgi:hypothetical protein
MVGVSLVDDGPTRRQPARRPPSRRPAGVRWDRVAIAVGALVALIVLLVVGIRSLTKGPPPVIIAQCTVRTQEGTYTLSPDQAANASTIAAVGHTLGLPDHAVTVAIATALQESQLINLNGGDRDSVGLFQQRPSEGWGSPAELLQPVYAATAFYQALEKVAGWQTMTVTEAAQAVQHSAAPDAYAYQEQEARSLAIALTGEVPAAFTCHASPPAAAGGWQAALAAQLGSVAPAATGAVPTAGTAVDPAEGWVLATWLVAHADQYGFRSVSFAGRTWTLEGGAWKTGGPADGLVHLS